MSNGTVDDLNYLKLTVDEIQNKTDQYLIDNNESPIKIWKDYVNLMFDKVPNVTLNLDKDDFILITTSDVFYLGQLLQYLKYTPDVLIELYMWWVTVQAMIINTTSDISEYIYKQAAPFNTDVVIKSR